MRVAEVIDRGEIAADEDLSVVLHGKGVNRGIGAAAGSKRAIHDAIGGETDDAGTGEVVELREPAADENLIIGLDREGIDRSDVGGRARIEGFVERAFVIETSEAIAIGVNDTSEETADENLSIFLDGQRANGSISADTGVEGVVQDAIGHQTRHAIASDIVEFREVAGDHEPAVDLAAGVLWRDGVHGAVGLCVRAEGDIEIAWRFAEGLVIDDG